MSTILSTTQNDVEDKIEAFDLMDEIKNLTNLVTMSATDHEFDVDLSYEAGIPDKVFGNFSKFKQVISILFTLGQKQATAEHGMSCHLKFLKMDEQK